MYRPRLVLIWMAVLLPPIAAFAAESPPDDPIAVRAFRAFDRRAEGGLPQSTVTALLQDDEGVLWLSTLDGVARFDGAHLAPIENESRAPWLGPYYALARRRGGGVLAGGGDGVHAFDGRAWRFWPTAGPVASLAVDSTGRIWCVEPDGVETRAGVEGDAPEGERAWTRVAVDGNPRVVVAASSPGAVWIGGEGGVELREGAESVRRRVAIDGRVAALLEDTARTLWIGTSDGRVLRLDPQAERAAAEILPAWDPGEIRALAMDRRGRLWAGGLRGGIAFRGDSGAWQVWSSRNGLRNTGVMSLLGDREGTLWIGFNGNGAQQWVGQAWSHRVAWDERDPSTYRVQVFGVGPDASGKGVLAAVFSRGFWHLHDGKLAVFGREHGLTQDVRSVVEPAVGTYWAAARTGIFELRESGSAKQTLRLASGFAFGFVRGPDGFWYATTSDGIFRRADGNWLPVEAWNRELHGASPRALLFRRGGEVWIGTLRGLVRFRDGARLPDDPSNACSVDSINALAERADGSVLAAGFGGVAIFRDAKWRPLELPSTAPGKTVYAIAERGDGAIWFGGSGGVARFENGAWRTWTDWNGLIENECNLGGLYVAPDGVLYAGTMGSLARYDPSSSATPGPPLHLYWRERPPPAGAEIGEARLALGVRSVDLSWSAPWLRPEPVEYRIRVLPLHPDWYAPQRASEFRLNGLEPGEWRIEVAARRTGSGDAAWTDPIATRFVVPAYWWESRGARIAVVALFAVAAGLFSYFRVRTLARRAEWLDREVARRTALLEEKHRELSVAHEKLADLALRDPLTGLFNRRALDARIDEEMTRIERYGGGIAVLILDLDGLKLINDTHGHEAGDAALLAVRDLMREICRRTDFIARFAGDEFAILCPEETEDGARRLADRLVRAFASRPIHLPAGGDIVGTTSSGVASHARGDGYTPQELLSEADRALYAAKHSGGNRVVTASSLARAR